MNFNQKVKRIITIILGIKSLKNILIRSPILLLFVYQFIDFTIDYFRYEYTIDLEITSEVFEMPAITVCIDKNHEYRPEMKQKNDPPLWCFYHDTLSNWKGCIHKYLRIRYKPHKVCLNLFYEDKY